MSKTLVLALAVAIVSMVACAPKPVLSPPPGPTIAVPVAPQVPAATPKAEDVAWARVVDEAKKEGRVVNYSFDMLGDIGLAVTKAFREKYGITLEVMASSAMVSIERIRSEYRVNQHAADMMDGSSIGTRILVNDGFAIGLMDLPVFKERDIWLFPPNSWDNAGRQLSTHFGALVPLINTRAVRSEEEPRSWYDLLDPKWRGQIVVADPRTSTTMDMLNVVMVERGTLEKDYFERLARQQPKLFVGGARGPIEAVLRGEGKITITTTSTALFAIAEGGPIRAVSPKEGAVYSPMGLTMLSKAPHPNATRVFINWLFSKEGAAIYAKARGGMSIRKGVPDLTPEAAKTSFEKIHVMTPEESDRASKSREAGILFKILSAAR